MCQAYLRTAVYREHEMLSGQLIPVCILRSYRASITMRWNLIKNHDLRKSRNKVVGENFSWVWGAWPLAPPPPLGSATSAYTADLIYLFSGTLQLLRWKRTPLPSNPLAPPTHDPIRAWAFIGLAIFCPSTQLLTTPLLHQWNKCCWRAQLCRHSLDGAISHSLLFPHNKLAFVVA